MQGPENTLIQIKNGAGRAFGRHGTIASVAVLALMGMAQPASAAGTAAGTKIDNIAKATYDTPAGTVDVNSNTVSITVDELLDITLTSADTGDVTTTPGAQKQVTKYTLTNTGNGAETFRLTADTARSGDDFDPAFVSVVIDKNGNNVYDEGVDEVHVAGSNDPVLNPDQSVTIFVLSNIPAGQGDGRRGEVKLDAQAKTGSGTPGTSYAGQGDGGGDAVVGNSTARANASGFFRVSDAAVVLTKEADITDPFGNKEAVPGATITYRLIAKVNGSGTLKGLRITDAIPDNSTYKRESITLENAALSDSASDADAGSFDGTGIAVSLGDIPGGQTRTVTFKVTIN